MTTATMKRILKSFNITNNFEDLQIPAMKTLFMNTNQGLDYHRDFLTFDMSTETLKIKQMKAIQVSDELETENIKVGEDDVIYFNLKMYRNSPSKVEKIAKDDKVLLIDKRTNSSDGTFTVQMVGRSFIQLDKPINVEFYHKLVYVKNNNYIKPDPLDKFKFYVYTPYTKNAYDIYLPFNEIIGIEMQSGYVGMS